MDLRFQVPVQYHSSQHQTLRLSPGMSPTRWAFRFDTVSSFLLDLFPHSSPVAYWAPTDLGISAFSSYLFAFSYSLWSSQGKNTAVVCHSLFQWTTFCKNSPHALHGLAHSFLELDKAVVHVDSFVSFLWLWFSFSVLWGIRIRGLWKLPDGGDWLCGKLGLVQMGGAVNL